jgi:transcriptional regulator with GAF, ATPase, and Fis domain
MPPTIHPVRMGGQPRERGPEASRWLACLREQGGNVNAVARVLGKHRTQVVRWLARYEIDARAVTDES